MALTTSSLTTRPLANKIPSRLTPVIKSQNTHVSNPTHLFNFPQISTQFECPLFKSTTMPLVSSRKFYSKVRASAAGEEAYQEDFNWSSVILPFVFPALGGLLFGYDIGATSGATLSLQSAELSGTTWFNLSAVQLGLVVSGSLYGALFGSILVYPIADFLGRKRELLLAALLYLLGGSVTAYAPGLNVLLLGRVLYGLGIGLAMHGAPLYIAETCPSQIRGTLISLKELFIVLGILLGYFVGSFQIDAVGGWRYMFGFSAPVALLMGLGVWSLPESPRWLLLRAVQGKASLQEYKEKAIVAYSKLRGLPAGDKVSEKQIEDTLVSLKTASGSDQESEGSIFEVFQGPSLKAFVIGGGLVLFQQITGQPSVLYYAGQILQTAGFSAAADATRVSVVIGVFKLLMTSIAILKVDDLGRKPLLIGGISGITISLLLLTAYYKFLGGFPLVAVGALLLYVGCYQGNVIHCTAKATVAHNFLKLKEGAIYSVKNFVVMQNKEDFRIRKDDTFMLEFNGSTSIRKSLVISKGFVRYSLQLVDFDHIKPTENKYLIDAVGYVTNVGRVNYTKTGSKNLDFYLANHRGQSIRVTLWGGLADVLIEKKATHVGMCPVVVTSTSAKQYNNKLYLSSSSSTQLLDSIDIPAIKELNSEICITDASKGASRIDSSEPREGSIENLLMWARNKRNDSAAFIIKAKIDNVRTRKGWNFPSCGGDNCRKGATRKNGRFWCESCSRPVEYPVIRYRLELGISDETEQTVVVLFDDASVGLIGFPASALVSDEDEGLDDHANLPSPIADLIGTTHMFEIKSHTYYEYGTFESFTCWQVDPHNPSAEPTSASTVDNETAVTCSSSKTPARSPTLTTLSKPVEDRKRKRVVIDDSTTEHELLPVNDVQGDESDIASNNTSSTSSPSFKRLIKTTHANDNKDDSVDIENSDADIELIIVDVEQDGDDSTLPVKKKQRRFVVEESE